MACGALDDVEVPQGDGVERPGAEGGRHAGNSSQFGGSEASTKNTSVSPNVRSQQAWKVSNRPRPARVGRSTVMSASSVNQPGAATARSRAPTSASLVS